MNAILSEDWTQESFRERSLQYKPAQKVDWVPLSQARNMRQRQLDHERRVILNLAESALKQVLLHDQVVYRASVDSEDRRKHQQNTLAKLNRLQGNIRSYETSRKYLGATPFLQSISQHVGRARIRLSSQPTFIRMPRSRCPQYWIEEQVARLENGPWPTLASVSSLWNEEARFTRRALYGQRMGWACLKNWRSELCKGRFQYIWSLRELVTALDIPFAEHASRVRERLSKYCNSMLRGRIDLLPESPLTLVKRFQSLAIRALIELAVPAERHKVLLPAALALTHYESHLILLKNRIDIEVAAHLRRPLRDRAHILDLVPKLVQEVNSEETSVLSPIPELQSWAIGLVDRIAIAEGDSTAIIRRFRQSAQQGLDPTQGQYKYRLTTAKEWDLPFRQDQEGSKSGDCLALTVDIALGIFRDPTATLTHFRQLLTPTDASAAKRHIWNRLGLNKSEIDRMAGGAVTATHRLMQVCSELEGTALPPAMLKRMGLTAVQLDPRFRSFESTWKLIEDQELSGKLNLEDSHGYLELSASSLTEGHDMAVQILPSRGIYRFYDVNFGRKSFTSRSELKRFVRAHIDRVYGYVIFRLTQFKPVADRVRPLITT